MFAIHDVHDLSRLDLPWWTYPAITRSTIWPTRSARVFEYGSGASSVWLGSPAREVHSVEHSKEWVDFLSPAC